MKKFQDGILCPLLVLLSNEHTGATNALVCVGDVCDCHRSMCTTTMGSTRGKGIWFQSYFLFLQEQIKVIIIISVCFYVVQKCNVHPNTTNLEHLLTRDVTYHKDMIVLNMFGQEKKYIVEFVCLCQLTLDITPTNTKPGLVDSNSDNEDQDEDEDEDDCEGDDDSSAAEVRLSVAEAPVRRRGRRGAFPGPI